MHRTLSNVLFALPLTFAVACDSDIELPDAEEAAVEPAAGELAAPAADPQAASVLATNIAKHPAFPTLSQRANVRVDQALDVIAAWSLKDRTWAVERLEACKQFEDAMCKDELEAMGFDLTITAAEAQAAQQIGAAFNLGTMPFMNRVTVLTEARQLYVNNGGTNPPPSALPGVVFGQPCDAACKLDAWHRLDHSYGGALAMVIPAPPPEEGDNNGNWWVPIVIEGAELVLECLFNPDCNPFDGGGGDDTPSECYSDSDCSSTQYCWKGPLSIGDNECRSKKQEGEYCSRDGKCLSGCCKFNLWDAGSTCRDADECD